MAHNSGIMEALGRSLMILGAVLIAVAALTYASPSIPLLGKLPGDIRIERPGFSLYLPITTCVVISLVVTGILRVISKLR